MKIRPSSVCATSRITLVELLTMRTSRRSCPAQLVFEYD